MIRGGPLYSIERPGAPHTAQLQWLLIAPLALTAPPRISDVFILYWVLYLSRERPLAPAKTGSDLAYFPSLFAFKHFGRVSNEAS